jgi:phenylpropionate dioxygenase-like ring-hydroxylating dioxygenase large terminal subunit
MTQILNRPDIGENGHSGEDYVPNGGRIPRLSGDIRHLVPKLGLREYWYPLCGVNRVPAKKALQIRMLGEDVCVFRGGSSVYALTDICPHRGARLSEGDSHFDGTIACPYHGWVFDGEGKNIAVLSEGPNATVTGKPGTAARAYPTQVLKGIVFAWMGEGSPAPIEEDVPEEFFRDDVTILFNDRIMWKTNWEVALENSMDSHVVYLHRDNLASLLSGDQAGRGGPSTGMKPRFTGNGFTYEAANSRTRRVPQAGDQDVYPQGWKWPKHSYRQLWSWFFAPLFNVLRVESPSMADPDRWVGGHHLPGMYRAGASTLPTPKRTMSMVKALFQRGGSSLHGLYTRQTVPVDEWLTRVWYYHSVYTPTPLHKAWNWFVYFSWGRWNGEYNFSQQDMSVMLHQVYDAPEKLSGTDAEVVQWRKLVVTKHFGGRNAAFQTSDPTEAVAAASVTAD